MKNETIDQRFEILDLAGSGGMGDVYKARDQQSGEHVALKLIRPDGGRSSASRFEREAATLAALSHPGIVRHVAHGVAADGRSYLAMEWLEGCTLSSRMRQGTLLASDALRVLHQVAEAMAEAHQRGLVHRDLKPSNIWLCDGQVERVKVLDFGLVRGRDLGATITHTNVVGTPSYMAPEQARGQRVDARADVFSMGVMLFECLTGRRPFEAEDLAVLLVKIVLDPAPRLDRIRPGLPIDLVELVARMLAKDPVERPTSGAAVAAALQHIQAPEEEAPAVRGGAEPQTLTATERRFQCIILGRRLDDTVTPEETVTAGDAMEPLLSDAGPPSKPQRDALLDALRRTADRHGAHVDRLLDGTLMVAFTGGGPATDLVARAARCALALWDVGPSLSLVLAAGWGLSQAGTLTGELPDQAVALMHKNQRDRATSVRVNALAAELLGDRFEVEREQGLCVLRAERVQVDGGRALLGRVSPFVGRARELSALTGLLDVCCEDSVARVGLVTAEAGMGKSRLRHEFIQKVKERGDVRVWTAAGDPQRQGSAYAMLAQAIRQAIGAAEGEPLESQQARLRARVERVLGGDDGATAALLGEVIAAPFHEQQAPLLRALRRDPGAMSDQMRAACGRWLAAEVAQGPVLLVLEDLHWGDLPTIKLLDEVLGQQSERPLMVLGLARPEVHELFPGLWARRELQELRLTALTRKASEALARNVLGQVSDELIATLAERAQGNAFFLEELIRSVARGHAEALPETVLAMLQQRLESQPAMARYVLRAASIFGRDFWGEGVTALVGGARRADAVREHLALLIENELIARVEVSRFPGTHQYRFRHDLLCDAAAAMLSKEDRALGSRLAADWLERTGETDPLVLARHRERAGQGERAAALYSQASRRATLAGDATSALGYVARARSGELSRELTVELHVAAAAAAGRIGRFDEAEREALAALEHLPRSSASWHHVAVLLVVLWTWKANVARVIELVGQMLQEEGGERIDLEHLYAWAGAAGNMFRVGRTAEALTFVRRIERRAPELGIEEPYTHLARFYHAYFVTHEPEVALREARAASAILERIGDLNTRDSTLLNAVDAALGIGAYEEAEAAVRPWLARAGAETHYTLLGELYLVRARMLQGHVDEALASVQRPIERFAATRNRLREGQARSTLAELLLARGDLAQARAEASSALEMLSFSPISHAEALALLASIELRLGEIEPALARARDAHARMEATGVVSHAEAEVRLTLAEALEAAGLHDEARAALSAARGRLLARAEGIESPALRDGFLRRVPANARTLSLAGGLG